MLPVQKLLLLLLLLPAGLINFSASAQQKPFLKDFYAYQLNNKVVVKWTIYQGNTCNGITIFRSGDSTNFEAIGHIYGICGSNSSDEPYIFIDSFPLLNQQNFYKLDFGGQAPSNTINIEFINTGKKQYYIDYRSKPKLYFINQQQEPVQLEVYDMQGRLMFSKVTNGNKIDFHQNTFPSGIYLFNLNGNYINISDKIFLY